MIDIDFDQLEHEINKAEDYLSFAPTPKGTLKPTASSSSSQNIFFYDEEAERKGTKETRFSDSMADTIRFAAPIEPALRSVPYESEGDPYFHAFPSGMINEDMHDGPESHSDEEDELDSLPRNEAPQSTSLMQSSSNLQNVTTLKKKVRPISMSRIEELHQSRLIRQQNLLKEKRALDELALAECTFQPHISRGSRNILNQKAQFEQLDVDCRNMAGAYDATQHPLESSTGVSERLYKEAAVRSAQNRWVKQEVEKIRQSHCTFQPMLNPRSRAHTAHTEDRRPIHERIADMQKEKKQYLHALKASIEEEQTDLTFRPQIDARSRVIAEQKLLGYGGNPHLPHPSQGAGEGASDARAGSAAPSGAPRRDTAIQQKQLSGEAEAAIVLGFHTDVGSRLLDQGKQAAKRKQQLLHDKENELAKAMEQAAVSRGSERILQHKAELQGTFEERQLQYRIKEKQRQDALLREKELQTNNWFRPQVDARSSQIVKESRPEVLLESASQRAERLAVTEAAQMEERRRRRAAEVYGAMTFTPAIDPLSRQLGHSSSIDELIANRRALNSRERIRQRVEEEHNQACTFHPQINELSKQLMEPNAEEEFLRSYAEEYAHIGWAEGNCPLNVSIEQGIREHAKRAQNGRINMQEPEVMARDIRLHLRKKEEQRLTELKVREFEELRDCTFQPSIEHSLSSLDRQRRDTSPVVIRGLGRHLELRHLSAKQKEDALQREKEVFSVKNVDKYRRAEDGSTLVQSFQFHLTEPRQHSRLDISRGDEVAPGSLNASTILSHRSFRQVTSPEAAAVWCV